MGLNTRIRRALLAATLAALLAPVTAQGAPGVAERHAPAGHGARSYWTAERMREAIPAEVPELPADAGPGTGAAAESEARPSFVVPTAPGEETSARLRSGTLEQGSGHARTDPPVDRDEILHPGKAPYRVQGKVFFRLAGYDYVCSGTALNSANRRVVWTAGHCVFERGAGFVHQFTFVPGFHNGNKPYGEWPAKRLATTKAWKKRRNLHFDVGAAVVERNAAGRTLTSVVGGRGIGFDQGRDHVYRTWGYPAEAPPAEFTGGRLFRCTSPFAGTDARPGGHGPLTQYVACDMTGGASGGGWTVGNSVLSVNSYKYKDKPDQFYGPYQSRAAKRLYRSVSGRR